MECRATIIETFDAPTERVWEILSDFHSLPRRMAGISRFVVDGAGVGAVRTFQIGDGPEMRERIEAFEPDQYHFAYSLLPPAFLEDYVADVRLVPQGPTTCQVTWSGRCTVSTEAEADERRIFLEGVYRNGIAWTRKELGLG